MPHSIRIQNDFVVVLYVIWVKVMKLWLICKTNLEWGIVELLDKNIPKCLCLITK